MKNADDDIELQHARKLNLVLRRMRADLNDEAAIRVINWVMDRNGINHPLYSAHMRPVPNPRRQPSLAAQVRKSREDVA